MLHRLAELDAELREAAEAYEFNRYARALMAFANDDLSAFFFDIRKDSLYCDAPDEPKRRAYRTVLDTAFHALVRWLSPILCFTAEEVWQTRFPDARLRPPAGMAGDRRRLAGSRRWLRRWDGIRAARERVTESIEPLRRDKVIGSSLEAKVAYPETALAVTGGDLAALAEIFIVSEVVPGAGEGIDVTRSDYAKCGRCWRLLPEVAEDGDLCGRCEGVVNG